MKNDEPDALDRALDKPLDNALAQYSSEEPLAGLEQRGLNRGRAGGAHPRSGGWRRLGLQWWQGWWWRLSGGTGQSLPHRFLERQPGPSHWRTLDPCQNGPHQRVLGKDLDRPGGLSHSRTKSALCWRWWRARHQRQQ